MASGILIGSAALAFYGPLERPSSDRDLILRPAGFARLGQPILPTGIPGRWVGSGLDVTAFGLNASHTLLARLVVREVEVAGLEVGLPSLEALWAIKSGAMAYAPKRSKTAPDLALIERMGGRSNDPDVLALESAIRLEASTRH